MQDAVTVQQAPEAVTVDTGAVKLASLGALDALPTAAGDGPWRDLVTEALLLELAASSGWGAQFGGTAMARSARVIRLPRHAASLSAFPIHPPVGPTVRLSAVPPPSRSG